MDKFIISGIGIVGMLLCGEVFAASPNTILHASDWNEQKNIIETLNAESMVFDDIAKEIRFSGNSFFRFTDTGNVLTNGSINTNTIISSSFALTPFSNLSQLPITQTIGTIALVQDVGMVYWSGSNWIAQNPKSTIVSYQDTVGNEQGLFDAFTTSDDFTPTLMGSVNTTLEIGSEVHVFENNTFLGKASVNNKNWSITLATQSEGMHQYNTKIVKSNGEKIDGTNNFNVLLFTPSMANSAGKLVSATSLGTASLPSIQAAAQNIAKIPSNFVAKYAVSSYKIEYYTTDKNGNIVLASGLLSLPQKPSGSKSPVMSFQHGTIFQNAQSPSNNAASYYGLLASLGYIVVSADYVGYGSSHGASHPYLQSEPSANAVIDFLKATREHIMKTKILTNEQLFLSGYSEGGYVTMAAQKKLETLQRKIFMPVQNISGAGPYNLSLTLDLLIERLDVDEFTRYLLSSKTLTKLYAEDLADEILNQLTENGDVIFDNQFLIDYFKDDQAKILANNVNKWKSSIPILLTHGRNDETVPFENSPDAISNMQSMGTMSIALSECLEVPSNHLNCTKPYLQSVIDGFGLVGKDL